MKKALIALLSLASVLSCFSKTRLEIILEQYSEDPKWLEAANQLKGKEFLLDTARKAHDYLNEKLGDEGSIIYVVDFKAVEDTLTEEGISKLGLTHGDFVWQGIEGSWIDKENPIMMVFVRASDGHIYLTARSKDKELKLDPVAGINSVTSLRDSTP
jgi:hypothetical protein